MQKDVQETSKKEEPLKAAETEYALAAQFYRKYKADSEPSGRV